ncbi:MAG: type III PLP-dependent enzyme [Proteobacteria bacterium]|nr:type III PLP-dependent enzyme [Pseudomonadota bacterium]MDA0861493.1 type III PLP-dependent enzyme [Pseudomonadota bacterium]MDA1031186.1 type III PLP-dependent enzyme [Pseudomonadota bacterium]
MTIQAALDQQVELESLLDSHQELSLDVAHVTKLLQGGYEQPVLILDLDIVRKKYDRFEAAMPGISPHYAVKANPDVHVLKALKEKGCKFEIASIQELDLLLSIGVDAATVYYSNPVKPSAFIKYAASKGVRWFAFDSKEELGKIQSLVPDAKLYLRFDTPNIGSDWPLSGKFGAKLRDIDDILDEAIRLDANLCGLTFHVGSQCRNVDNWNQAIDTAKKIFKSMVSRGLTPELLNIGGGYPVRLTKPIPSIEYIGNVIKGALRDIDEGIQIAAEPGRYMVSDAAYFVCQVIGTSIKGDERWMYLDAGVFGGLMECTQGIQYQIDVNNKSGNEVPWYVAGPSCDSVDVLGREQMLPATTVEGDLLYFPNAGAYTTVYANEFNGFPLPKTLILNERG